MSISEQKVRIILASSSPRRQELLALIGLPFRVQSSDADESTEEGLDPHQIVEQLAERKARAVLEQGRASGTLESDAVIIGSDTIVVQDGHVLGKPKDEADALHMLRMLQGREHEVYTGIACILTTDGSARLAHERTVVRMKSADDERLRRYIATGEPMDKAGSYGIQGFGATLVERIEGDYFSVVGLPVSKLYDMLSDWGLTVF
ncbi:nucleoside triphosphate pyrophosphatase [Paenibacillus sp. YYML68]|uniref:Maf family protein n=1 Tax=Paenibacillus sp. YYML68 TaxID=2909250 RepID=UPI00248FF5C8|nr:Maf family protein [Paenibacillus sp. YYML68]